MVGFQFACGTVRIAKTLMGTEQDDALSTPSESVVGAWSSARIKRRHPHPLARGPRGDVEASARPAPTSHPLPLSWTFALDHEPSVGHFGDSPFGRSPMPFVRTISFYDPDRMDNLLRLHS